MENKINIISWIIAGFVSLIITILGGLVLKEFPDKQFLGISFIILAFIFLYFSFYALQ